MSPIVVAPALHQTTVLTTVAAEVMVHAIYRMIVLASVIARGLSNEGTYGMLRQSISLCRSVVHRRDAAEVEAFPPEQRLLAQYSQAHPAWLAQGFQARFGDEGFRPPYIMHSIRH